MKSNARKAAAGVGALAAIVVTTNVVGTAPYAMAAPAGAQDVTAAVLADRDVTLGGDAVVTVPAGTTTYDGVFRGEGTLTVRGNGTLVLTKDSDFTLPKSRQRQKVTTQGGNHPYVTTTNPDPPAVTVERGATLQYGNGGTTGLIGHFPYNTPAFRLNQDNIRVDGTLRLSLKSAYNLGTISGSGLITQPRFLWGTWDLSGTHSFSGVIDNGTQVNAGRPEFATSLPNVRKVLNQGTWTVDTPLGQTVTMGMDFYQREYGSDINVQSRPGSKVVLTGQYSWSDHGGDTNPSLSDPALNWTPARKNVNKRGTNIKGANVQWGDGTTNKIFMPGTAETVYINLLAARSRSLLTFAYNGPVTLGAPIGGGLFHDTLSAPGAGDIVIKGISGNDVTFAAVQYYNGSTTIEKGAVLRLGSGKKGGDSRLYTKGDLYKVVDNGALVLRNTAKPLVLSKISGSGSLTQSGAATTTLSGDVTYTGTTTVTKGTLALAGNTTLARSKAIRLTASGARLDVRKAAGGGLRVGRSLTGKGTVAGSVTNEGRVEGALTITGDYAQGADGELAVRTGGKPLKVGGRVKLAGKLDVTAGKGEGEKPAGKITLLSHTGKAKTTGAFAGLREGARVKVAGTEYRISYRGGDGNDVVLTKAKARASATPSATARSDNAPLAAETAKDDGDSTRAWWPLTLIPLLLGGLLFPAFRRRRAQRRGGGRHAAAR
ncbi:autotransporter-associated beta strand repeat-containing protein [Streptomyces sp. PSKA54]|uniref:Autotransporter-associated beta strand repeat-containing protein n=1 Tax=Streptomyces himalayensis subsp. aureolus TaxID=2758039 RepID=A0A7W2HF71_9ACTN|nr:autotransporter-associated beta strand repeat-containing protein [Streptomyces himalayensis]MBA4861602.1 autotransporter-associated beta strand repeat-containing protein [Streptomyces himalayensis subsp. aureolus]